MDSDLEISPVNPEIMEDYWKDIDNLCKEVQKMQNLVLENKNTQKDIKGKAKILSQIGERVIKHKERQPTKPLGEERRLFDFGGIVDTPKIHREQRKENVLDENSGQPGEQIFCGRCNEEIGKEKRILKEVEEEKVERLEEMEEEERKTLRKKKWPTQIYKVTTLKQGRISRENLEATGVILVEEEEADKLIKDTGRNWIDRFTGHPGLLKQVKEGGGKLYKCRKQSDLTAVDELENDKPTVNNTFIAVMGRKEERKL